MGSLLKNKINMRAGKAHGAAAFAAALHDVRGEWKALMAQAICA